MEQEPPFASSAYQMLTSILSSTVQKSRENPPRSGWRIWRGAGDCWLQRGLLDCSWLAGQTVLLLHTDWKHPSTSSVVHCAIPLVKDSYNSSLATISCACASIDFLIEITSWSVDSIWRYRRMRACVRACVRAARPAHFEGLWIFFTAI
jgi:hypothetical protein